MNKRETFIEYVKHGGAPICSPQIGAGAGFDAKVVGKDWLSKVTLEDTLDAVTRFDIVPLINVGLCDLGECNPALVWREVSMVETEDTIIREHVLHTPKGTLSRKYVEQKLQGITCVKYPVSSLEDLDVLEYYIDAAVESDFSFVTDYTRGVVETVAGRGALSVQWPVQPYEMLCFPNTVDTLMLAYDCPEKFLRLMDRILLLDDMIMVAVASGGADFVFLGGPGAEMASPRIYEDFILPYSAQASAMAHKHGLLVYSHICSPIEPFLSMGFYNRMGLDLFETLSPPPVGNVELLSDALEKLDPGICTRGNLGLDILLEACPETVKEKTLEILDETAGRKHMVAASDYLFYEVPEENIHAMATTVSNFK